MILPSHLHIIVIHLDAYKNFIRFYFVSVCGRTNIVLKLVDLSDIYRLSNNMYL